MKDHDDFKDQLNRAELRQMERIAEMMERCDKAKAEQEKLDKNLTEAKTTQALRPSRAGGGLVVWNPERRVRQSH